MYAHKNGRLHIHKTTLLKCQASSADILFSSKMKREREKEREREREGERERERERVRERKRDRATLPNLCGAEEEKTD